VCSAFCWRISSRVRRPASATQRSGRDALRPYGFVKQLDRSRAHRVPENAAAQVVL
jgi:hypothetical protein